MDARIVRQGEVLVVALSGYLDFSTAESFRNQCLKRLLNHKVVFNFKDLNFVGSSGIRPFLDALDVFASQTQTKPKFCTVPNEFKHLLLTSALAKYEIHDSSVTAVDSFEQPPVNALENTALAELNELEDLWKDDSPNSETSGS